MKNQTASFLQLALAAPVDSLGLPQGRAGYVCNFGSETVSVIDLDNKALIKNVKVGKYPIASLCSPHDRSKLIVALHNYDQNKDDALLEGVDLENSKTTRVQYPANAVPSWMAYDSRQDRIYVADENLCKVHVHDGKTLKELSSLPAGLAPVHTDISGDGRYLAVTNRKSADLYLYDLMADPTYPHWITSIHLGATPGNKWPSEDKPYSSPFDVKFSADPNTCYVSDWGTGELLAVNIPERIVTDRIDVGEHLFGMALDRTGTAAYVCDFGKNSLYIVDLDSKRIEEIAGLDGVSSHCAVDEKGDQLMVTCQGGRSGGAIHFIDLGEKRVAGTIVDDKIQGCMGATIRG
jgi:YVTN family beta-propeller protein